MAETKKIAVEDCEVRMSTVGLGDLLRAGVGAHGVTDEGVDLRVVRVGSGDAELRVNYAVSGPDGHDRHREVVLRLLHVSSGCCRRWLALCPACREPTQELYVAPGGTALSCRSCSGLTYKSRQTRVVRLYDVIVQEEVVLDRLRRARSSKSISRLSARAERLRARRLRLMTKPVMDMLGVLEKAIES